MSSLQPYFIAPDDMGFETDKKPFLIPDNAFQQLYNAYVYRNRVKKREGNKFLGQLRRSLSIQPLGVTNGGGSFSGNIISILTLQANSTIIPDSITINIGGQVFSESPSFDGALINGIGGIGTINYSTGAITIQTNPVLVATAITIDFSYAPGLPVMGIFTRDISNINNEETVFFDTTYAYHFVGTDFEELPSITPTIWTGGDADFFWAENYRGITDNVRLFFATNFNNGNNIPATYDPIRYYDGTTWTNFIPLVDATHSIFQTRLIIAYYGRLIFLNVWEGLTASGPASALNFFNRCRFSQIGNPIAVDAWRSDQFGKGGFIDAPTNEAIISCEFNKNTLIVFFERSTWQLRYVGEYGVPFLWERITSDFGCESTNSPILFDPVIFAVGDKGIIQANAIAVSRIDEKIPDTVFTFKNASQGVKRVIGIRDFQKEVNFWCYNDSNEDPVNVFPNRILVYNYRNMTWATYRDNVTFFGTFQSIVAITWDSTRVTWDDAVGWDDPVSQSLFPIPVSGNQQGYVHYFAFSGQNINEKSLTIKNVIIPVLLTDAVQLNIITHNLEVADLIYLEGLIFQDPLGTPIATDLNDRIFEVGLVINVDNILIYEWDGDNYTTDYIRTPTSTAIYMGLGTIFLLPALYVQTKDFNPYMTQGIQFKISYIDFLTTVPESGSSDLVAMSVQLFGNTSYSQQGNLLIGNQKVETTLPSPFGPGSDIAWHRFFSTFSSNFISIVLTYDDALMNDLVTHQNTWELNAMRLWIKPGGRNVF